MTIMDAPITSKPRYKIIIRGIDGLKLAEIVDYIDISYTKKRNAPGDLAVTLIGDHLAIPLLYDDCFVEVWRSNIPYGLQWYCDFYGLYRGNEWEIVDNSKGLFTLFAVGILEWFSDRVVAYAQETNSRSDYTSSNDESIINTLVRYNCTSDATVGNGRVRNGRIPSALGTNNYVSVETAQSRGQTVDKYQCAEDSVLNAIQQLARQQRCSFDLVKIGSEATMTWEFRYIPRYTNTVFTQNKTATVIFSMPRGNVQRIRYRYDRRKERTVLIGGGSGGESKSYFTRTSYKYNSGTSGNAYVNDRETYVSVGSGDTQAKVEAEVSKELAELESREEIEFDVLQIPSTYYGLHYNLNDYVTGVFKSISRPFIIDSVSVRVNENTREEVNIGLETAEVLY